MNITVNIQAPELAKAIESLAAALSGKQIQSVLTMDGREVAAAVVPELVNANVVPFQQSSAPIQQQPPAAVPTAPVQQPVVPHQPVTQPAQTVPTSAPTYTMDQLAVAATQLMDAGRQPELVSLLSSFGVPSLMALPKEQYGAFATKLREMGAKI